MRRPFALLVVSALALAACGGGSDSAATATAAESDATAETPVPVETATAETAGPETAGPGTAAPDTAAPAATTGQDPDPAPPTADGVVAVSLVEWAIETPAEVAAGTVTFEVSNGGSFPPHFAVARGNSYEELPLSGGGAIDEAALGEDYLGRTSNLQGGATETIEFDLAPGNYVFFCNIAGTISHASQGQVLSVTAA